MYSVQKKREKEAQNERRRAQKLVYGRREIKSRGVPFAASLCITKDRRNRDAHSEERRNESEMIRHARDPAIPVSRSRASRILSRVRWLKNNEGQAPRCAQRRVSSYVNPRTSAWRTDACGERATRARGARILFLAGGGDACTLFGIDPRRRHSTSFVRPTPSSLRSVHRPAGRSVALEVPFFPTSFKFSRTRPLRRLSPDLWKYSRRARARARARLRKLSRMLTGRVGVKVKVNN